MNKMNPIIEKLLNTIFLDDCRIFLNHQIPENIIDLIIADPPFGIGFKSKRSNYNRNGDLVVEGYIEIPSDKYREFSVEWIKEVYRILKTEGTMYVFSGWNHLEDILYALRINKFYTISHLIYKFQFGVYTQKRYVSSHYHILFVAKNKTKYFFHKAEHYPEDVWIIKRPYAKGIIKVPNKLPPELIRKILYFSSKDGDIIVDPFCGSGSIPIEILKLNQETNEKRFFIGIEKAKPMYDFIIQRITEYSLYLR